MNNDEKIIALIRKDMKGSGSIKEWIKKHKNALAVAGSALAGALGTIATIAIASSYPGKNKFTPEEEALAQQIGLYGVKPQPIREISEPKTPPFSRSRSPSLSEEEKEVAREIGLLPRLTSLEAKRMGYGNSSCCCGRDCNKIMEELGGYQVAQNYLVKHPKVGAGLIDNLIHKGITKGFNFVGNVGLNLLIETIVKIIGEPFRKDINKLVKKYGWKSITLIKKYAHKGINYVKQKVDEKYGGMLCPQCNDFLDNEFRCGNVDSLEKMGEGWKEDLATGLTWFNKSVLAPAVRIIPGSLGEALAYAPENVHKIAEADSNWRYKNPFEEEGQELPTYASARSKPPKKGKGYIKHRPQYKNDTLTTLLSLIPSKLIGSVVGEAMPVNKGDFSILPEKYKPKSGRGKKLVKINNTLQKIIRYIPVELLKELFWEVVKKPSSISILPKRFLHDEDDESIWGDGRSGGTKMLPNPFYTDKEKEMMILPNPNEEEEPDMTILPYPYTKPYFKDGKGQNNYSKLQDPNYNTNKLIKGVSNNQDYKEYESGMKNKAQGVIIMGGKKKQTKKSILKKLRFEN